MGLKSEDGSKSRKEGTNIFCRAIFHLKYVTLKRHLNIFLGYDLPQIILPAELVRFSLSYLLLQRDFQL